jgi:DNA-binding transcriptional ArsR family regulator
MMTELTRDLLKVLASKGRVEILRTLRAFPEEEFTINGIARAAEVPVMTAWRATKDLRAVGLVRTKKVGNATVVSLTSDAERLRLLRVLPETDPHRDAARLFAHEVSSNPWAEECRLFGTIARGEHIPGEEVDVAVVYDGEEAEEGAVRASVEDIANSVRTRSNVAIAPLCIEKKEMGRRGGLAAELRDNEVLWKRTRSRI